MNFFLNRFRIFWLVQKRKLEVPRTQRGRVSERNVEVGCHFSPVEFPKVPCILFRDLVRFPPQKTSKKNRDFWTNITQNFVDLKFITNKVPEKQV